MNVKSKADFINSVAAGMTIPCPKCGTTNEAGNNYCISCGTEIDALRNSDNAPVFKETNEKVSFMERSVKYDESCAVFAQGLPEWSIEPPQVAVRRR